VGSDEITWGRLRDILANIDRDHRLRYCVYRSDRPITAKNLHDASLIARVRPLSCWNVNGRNVDKPIDHALGNQYVLDWHQWNPFRSANVEGDYGTDCRMERLVIEDGGKPLPRGTGLYVHTIGESGEGGRGYYAVVTCVDGVENTAEITAENTTPAVEEIPGVGEPVLQKVFPPKPYFNYREKRLHYVRWVGGHGPHPQDAPTRASGPRHRDRRTAGGAAGSGRRRLASLAGRIEPASRRAQLLPDPTAGREGLPGSQPARLPRQDLVVRLPRGPGDAEVVPPGKGPPLYGAQAAGIHRVGGEQVADRPQPDPHRRARRRGGRERSPSPGGSTPRRVQPRPQRLRHGRLRRGDPGADEDQNWT